MSRHMEKKMQLFLPCAAGVEDFLAEEASAILSGAEVRKQRAGVRVLADWRAAMQLNLHSRLAQRVLVQVAHAPYAREDDLYACAHAVPWADWFSNRHTFKVEVTAQRSPLKSLNFAALRIKDAVADRFRAQTGSRPSVDTHQPQVRIYAHLDAQHLFLYIDTSGEPLFKRGWREDKGAAPLKETLAAAMLAACGWQPDSGQALYDPCCGSGTIAIEAAQIACRMAPGRQRRFAFEHLLPHQPPLWQQLLEEARAAEMQPKEILIFGSDVAHRMVDFAQRNAQRAGVAHAMQLRGGDALQRMPPATEPDILLLNPPYGERIAVAGVARKHDARMPLLGRRKAPTGGREQAVVEAVDHAEGTDFFARLASHWKQNYAGWTAWVLSPDMALPRRMRLQAARRVPLWNGPIECRLFRFDLVAGSPDVARRKAAAVAEPAHAPCAPRGTGTHAEEAAD